ncbi:MAG: hypothetical protein AAGI30_00840 [Planctomycetota bacterium]
MKINCIHCGHNFSIDAAYDDYEGLVRCSTCGGLLEIKTSSGALRAVRPGAIHGSAQHAPAETSTTDPEVEQMRRELERLTAEVREAAAEAVPAPESPSGRAVKPL